MLNPFVPSCLNTCSKIERESILYTHQLTTMKKQTHTEKQSGKTHEFRCLYVGNAIEDDVETSWQDPWGIRFPCHGVGLARVGDSIGKQEPILSLQELLRKGKSHHVKHSRLRGAAIHDPLEGVLRL